MNRIDRLMAILTVLQSRKYCTAEFLAEKFGMSIRTVYRDIKALGEIGIPVGFENAKGYFIAQGYFLPPLSLTIEEANALILLNTLADKFADNSIVKHSRSALTKIKAGLRHADKNRVNDLSESINVYVRETERSSTTWLSVIQNAIADKTVLKIQYTDNSGKKSSREIESVGLIFYTGQWHLYAWCCTKKAYRDFKVSMITAVTETGQPHSIRKHQSIEEYVKIF